MKKHIGVIISGGTGFGAAELLRLLCTHPNVEVKSVISKSSANKKISSLHPQLLGFYDFNFDEEFNPETLKGFKEKIILVAQPHGTSSAYIASIFQICKKENIKIIDLSGDLRLKDIKLHKKFYPDSEVCEEIRKEAIYGAPEFFKEEIRKAFIVSNPGCMATASNIGVMPLVKLEVDFTQKIIINLVTGSSGSGRALKESTHHPLRHANFFAYKMLNHQHEPEVEQLLECFNIESSKLSLVAHSAPLSRGIFATIYASLKKPLSKEEIQMHIKDLYKDAPFVRVLPFGTSPEVNNIVGSNFCDISFTIEDKELVIMIAIDNLVKGMAGQALQNMNIMFGLDETIGLNFPALKII